MTDDILVWDAMVDAANQGCVMSSEGCRLAILTADAELTRLRAIVARVDDVENYYKRLKPKWSKDATDWEKTLVIGNLRAFSAWLKEGK